MDTVTSLTLLNALRDNEDHAAWQRFTERYQPMVVCFARKLGLRQAEAEDAGQETMLGFVQSYRTGGYDPAKGRLRSFLYGIAVRKVSEIRRRMGREIIMADRTDASGFLGSIESPNGAEAIWEVEWRRAVLRSCFAEAAGMVSETTFSAFELYALKRWPVDKVAAKLGITANAVYIAKSRVLDKIREIQQQIEEIW